MAIEITSSNIFSNDQLCKHSKIYAGPGAGKTYFLVENVKHIVTMHPLIAKSRRRKVLCITYTNAAVNEIERRLNDYSCSVEAYTIHGFIIEHIIKPFQQELQQIMFDDFGIIVSKRGQITSQIEGLGILHGVDKDALFQYVIDVTSEETKPIYSKKIMGEISVDIDSYSSDSISFANRIKKDKFKFSTRLEEQHIIPIKEYIWSVVRKLTHDEILYFGCRILERNPVALYATRVKFPFIFVDEFQDTNPLQTKLIKMIGAKSTVITIIGDLAQSIYSFQGAKPTQFTEFALEDDREMSEYIINGNRRSINNIVHFCNYLRQSDKYISQRSIKEYIDDATKELAETKVIHFIVGRSAAAMNLLSSIVSSGGVVLTRTWAAAFEYIQGITPEQSKLLKKIYDSYYASPIDIRRDIEEYNYVAWVRAFKFIFGLWHGFHTGSFYDVLGAFSLFTVIDHKKITPKFIASIKHISESIFRELQEDTTDKITVEIISAFNRKVGEAEFSEIRSICGSEFTIPIFEDADSDDLKSSVGCLDWKTSFKLFNEVFAAGSKYMTVHQAKGLEWEKVVVSLSPNPSKSRDNTTLEVMFQSPQLVCEENAHEFTRMYYVACSRAMEELYIHLPGDFHCEIIKTALSSFVETTGQPIRYDFI